MILSFLVYAGGLLGLVSMVAIVRPLRFLRISTRGQAAGLLLVAAMVILAGWLWPAPERHASPPTSRLDEFAPVYEFNEWHSIHIDASPEAVFKAIRNLRAQEIRLFNTLTRIRRLGRPTPPSIMNAPRDEPLLNVALRSGFVLLADEPPHEIVFGTLVVAPPGYRPSTHPTAATYKALDRPGFAKATMNFIVRPDPTGGSVVTTETRVHATDGASRRSFALYWRIIYPGSALIRRGWLHAIRLRAESEGQTSVAR